jgi:predicted enzyme related to lactoylglutathione lyase
LSAAHPITEWQIVTRDPAAAEAFYTGLFGWRVRRDNALGYRRLETGGLDGGIWPAPPDAQGFVQLFVAVDDLSSAVERARSLGAEVIVPITELPDGGAMAILRDPVGIPFGMVRRS